MRLSTELAAAAFIGLAAFRRRWWPVAAGLVWLTGFEAACQITKFATGKPFPHFQAPGAVAYVILGVFTVAWFTRQGIRPNVRLLAATAAVWVIWVAIGFPSNGHTMVGFDPTAEALNEAAKTLLALAYLVPLLMRRSDVYLPEVCLPGETQEAAPSDLRA